MNFTPINFVDTCQVIPLATSTTVQCYSSTTSFIMIVFSIFLFFAAMFMGYSLFRKKHL